MPYAEGTAYLTHAELTAFVDASDVVSVLGDPASSDPTEASAATARSLTFRQAASAYVDERAVARGITPPLAAGLITDALKRRVAIITVHLATPRTMQFRDDKGRGPYQAEFEAVIAELDAWKAGLTPVRGETVDDAAAVAGVSSAARRRPIR